MISQMNVLAPGSRLSTPPAIVLGIVFQRLVVVGRVMAWS